MVTTTIKLVAIYTTNERCSTMKNIIKNGDGNFQAGGDIHHYVAGETFCDYLNKLNDARQYHSQFSYDSELVDFHGRSLEIEKLLSFCVRSERLLWWAITGSGGVGKSRLAYEFGKTLREDKFTQLKEKWIVKSFHWTTFYNWFQSSNNQGFGKSEKNILVIIDYVHAYERQIAEWITYLEQKTGNQNIKIRILMIERAQQTKKLHSNKLIQPNWVQFFSDGFPNNHMLWSLCHDSAFLNLGSIDYNASVKLIQDYAFRNNKAINESLIATFIKHAKTINKNKVSPLYLLLIADAWINHQDIFRWDRDDILDYFAKREIDYIRRCVPEQQEQIRRAIIILHRIATIIEKLHVSQFPQLFELDILSEYRELIPNISDALTNNPYYFDKYIYAIEPDLIGEYFVADFIEESENIEQILALLDFLILVDRDALLRFFIRFRTAFPVKFKDSKLKSYIDSIFKIERSLDVTGNFTIRNEIGEEIDCEVLFTFDSDETKKSYIVFTDNSLDNNGNIKVYANTYDSTGASNDLGVIETEEEWGVIERLLTSLQEQMMDDSDLANNEEKKDTSEHLMKSLRKTLKDDSIVSDHSTPFDVDDLISRIDKKIEELEKQEQENEEKHDKPNP